jgi:hypothetical protein
MGSQSDSLPGIPQDSHFGSTPPRSELHASFQQKLSLQLIIPAKMWLFTDGTGWGKFHSGFFLFLDGLGLCVRPSDPPSRMSLQRIIVGI